MKQWIGHRGFIKLKTLHCTSGRAYIINYFNANECRGSIFHVLSFYRDRRPLTAVMFFKVQSHRWAIHQYGTYAVVRERRQSCLFLSDMLVWRLGDSVFWDTQRLHPTQSSTSWWQFRQMGIWKLGAWTKIIFKTVNTPVCLTCTTFLWLHETIGKIKMDNILTSSHCTKMTSSTAFLPTCLHAQLCGRFSCQSCRLTPFYSNK